MRYQRIVSAVGTSIFGITSCKIIMDKSKVFCDQNVDYMNTAIRQSQDMLSNIQSQTGCPGISICVAVNGKTVWKEGLGHCDLENKTPCKADTVMKIASLSKPITMAVVAKTWEKGQIDFDTDISQYVTQWPIKLWDGKKTEVTVRQLGMHKSGVRNYKRMNNPDESIPLNLQFEEYHITKHYKDVNESLSLFIKDPLLYQPGSTFHYSNHGYTLLSAVLEGATDQTFPELVHDLLHDLDMNDTFVVDDGKLMYKRSRHYTKSASGEVINAPFVETSFKLAGAGMWSSAVDMVKFGNMMLYSYQCEETAPEKLPGYLKQSTVELLWSPNDKTKVSWDERGLYGMGWQLVPYSAPGMEKGCRFLAGHTGTTVDASSAFIVLPCETSSKDSSPHGVVVAILCNMQGVKLGQTAVTVAKTFEKCVK